MGWGLVFQGVYVEVSRQLAELGSHLPPYGSWGIKLRFSALATDTSNH